MYTVFKILFNFTPSKGEPQALENLTYKNLVYTLRTPKKDFLKILNKPVKLIKHTVQSDNSFYCLNHLFFSRANKYNIKIKEFNSTHNLKLKNINFISQLA